MSEHRIAWSTALGLRLPDAQPVEVAGLRASRGIDHGSPPLDPFRIALEGKYGLRAHG